MSRTPEEANSAINKLLDGIDWKPVPPPPDNADNLPYATHSGTLIFGGVKLRVHQLNDGRRIIDADGLAKLFGVE